MIDFVLLGHAVHVVNPFDPFENFPAAHSVQPAEPFTFLYFPASHCAQEAPFGPLDPALQEQLETLVLPAAEKELLGHI